MLKRLLALGSVALAAASTGVSAQFCGFGGFPYWAPWGSGWGCWGYAATGIHLFPYTGGCCW